MPSYFLQIREHQEFGGYGIRIKNIGRDYFEPAIGGLQVAHDILEHVTPEQSHINGYIDEFMALGGLVAGRIASGWATQYGRRVSIDDLSDDINTLVNYALCEGDDFTRFKTNNRLQDADLMCEIRSSVRKGFIQGLNEWQDSSLTELPAKYREHVNIITGWVCKGYQLYKKRFGRNLYDVSTHLFDNISKVADNWLKCSDEGAAAILTVNFTTCEVNLTDDYYM